jgi:NAD(P)-dependent dehydrogenase (short-subunit alcohol dehydrogenase family)
MELNLKGRRVIVAGGSRGIGRSIALGFAQAGAAVSICARGADTLEATRKELAAFGGTGGLQRLNNLRGRRKASEMGKFLLGLQPGGTDTFEESMKTLALSRQGRGVMIVISDFLLKDGYEKGLRYVAGRGYDLWCIQTLAPQELDPAVHGLSGDFRLVDLEDRDEAEVTASAALVDQYRANLGAWCAGLRDFAVRRSIMHLVVDTGTEMDALVLEWMRRRGLVR